MTIAYVVIFVFGFFGNACIIYIVASHKTMKSTFNFLIVNMAIGDLLVSLFIMPSEVSKKCVQFRHNIFNFSQARYETMITKAKKNSVANSSFTWHDLIPSSSGKNTFRSLILLSHQNKPEPGILTRALGVLWVRIIIVSKEEFWSSN